jgi:hypothetical protein
MSTTKRLTSIGVATLALASPVAVAALIAHPVDGAASAGPVGGIPVALGSAFPQHGPGQDHDQDQDCWGPDMMDPDCWGGDTSSPGHPGPGYWDPDMMGPGMMGPGYWSR